MSKRLKSLTDMQSRFVAAFLAPGPTYLNATRSARAAGYRWPGKLGPRTLNKAHVRRIIDHRFTGLADQGGGSPTCCPNCGFRLRPKLADPPDAEVVTHAFSVGADPEQPGAELLGDDLEAFVRLIRKRRGD